MSIAQSLYALTRSAIDERGGGRLRKARIAVGELSAVEPHFLETAWQMLLAGGADDGAQLGIDWCPVRQVCARCGEVPGRAAGTWLRLCPRCEEPLAIEGGRQLDLLQIEFDAAAAEVTQHV